MRKYLTAIVLVLALMGLGCTGAQKVSKDTTIKCPKCGVEFPAGEGMQGH